MMRSYISYRLMRPALQKKRTPLHQARSFHKAKAQFISISDKGIPTSSETEIRVGDPHEAFIYLEPELGDIIKLAATQQSGPQNVKTVRMVFNHKTRGFHRSIVSLPLCLLNSVR